MNPAQNTACNHNALDIHRFFCSLKKVDQFQLPGYSSHLLLCNYPQHFTELLLQNMGFFTVKKNARTFYFFKNSCRDYHYLRSLK